LSGKLIKLTPTPLVKNKWFNKKGDRTMTSESSQSNRATIEDYVNSKVGISRKALNIRATLGIVVFPFLMLWNYYSLGKKAYAAVFILVIFVVFKIAKNVDPMVALLLPIIYVAAWVHTNALLTAEQLIAKEQYLKAE